MRVRMKIGRCCCDTEDIVLPVNLIQLGFGQVEVGSGTTVTTSGGTTNVFFYREAGINALGPAYFFEVGAVPQNLTSAMLSFYGHLDPHEGGPWPPGEPVLALDVFCFPYDTSPGYTFDWVDDTTSKLDLTIPAVPQWGAYPGIILTTPDISAYLNELTSDPGFNFATQRVAIGFRPKAGTTPQFFASGLRMATWPLFDYEAKLDYET